MVVAILPSRYTGAAEVMSFFRDVTDPLLRRRGLEACFRRVNFQLESLILAQNERWRRA